MTVSGFFSPLLFSLPRDKFTFGYSSVSFDTCILLSCNQQHKQDRTFSCSPLLDSLALVGRTPSSVFSGRH